MFDLSIYIQGFATGAGLIIAIGAQNAFVLSQAVRRDHAYPVAALCALLDVVLISVGVLGLGTLVADNRALNAVASIGGAAFLIWFGARSLKGFFRPRGLEAGSPDGKGLKKALLATLAVSLLNPHVYLDTVVMLGAISGSYPGMGRYLFGAGAGTASVLWFFSLSFAGSRLAPVLRKPRAWQIISLLICLMVWWVAASLLYGFFSAA